MMDLHFLTFDNLKSTYFFGTGETVFVCCNHLLGSEVQETSFGASCMHLHKTAPI